MQIKLHSGQHKIFSDSHRFRTLVAGRRFGKSRCILYELLCAALGFEGRMSKESPQVVLGVMPTLTQARAILWEPLVSLCESAELSPYVLKINRSSFTIEFQGAKPNIQIVGANDRNGDGLRGKRIFFIALDEYQDIKPGVFDLVVLPALADTQGSRALFSGTPKGKLNSLYDIYSRQDIDPDQYKSFHMATEDNPHIPRSFIAQQRRILPPKVFEQEFRASFVQFEGQIFSELDEANLIAQLPSANPADYDSVIMGVDFGDVHPAFTCMGCLKGFWHYLEGWHGQTGSAIAQPQQDIELVRLAKRWQPQGAFCDPSRPSAILGIRALGLEHNLEGLKRAIAGYNRIEEGLSQMHSLIYQRRLLFPNTTHEKTPGEVSGRLAYELFQAYHYKSDRAGLVTQIVEEGQNDHIVDSSRYLLALPNPMLDLS
jgi:hypothetical protein